MGELKYDRDDCTRHFWTRPMREVIDKRIYAEGRDSSNSIAIGDLAVTCGWCGKVRDAHLISEEKK